MIRKTFRYRLDPTKAHLEKFVNFSGASRWIFNRGLAQRSKLWEEEKRSLTLFDQNNELVVLKQREETGWLSQIHSQVLQQSLHDLDQAFSNFFRRVKNKQEPGYPRFRCKGENDSFRYPQGVKVQGHLVWLPKIGFVRFRKSRELQGKIKQTTVIKEGKFWYVCFSCEWEEKEEAQSLHRVVGIDVGLENFATLAFNGQFEKVGFPGFLTKHLSHLKYLSRQLSKKVKLSKNWQKAKANLSSFHAKLKAKRSNFLHQLSSQIIKNHDVIVIESLKVKKLLMQAPKKLSQSISDASWSQFLGTLKYKCEYKAKKLIEAGDFFPSTKLCSRCKCLNKMSLSVRQYNCECGLSIHRDENAALNLRAVGTTVLKACGAAL